MISSISCTSRGPIQPTICHIMLTSTGGVGPGCASIEDVIMVQITYRAPGHSLVRLARDLSQHQTRNIVALRADMRTRSSTIPASNTQWLYSISSWYEGVPLSGLAAHHVTHPSPCLTFSYISHCVPSVQLTVIGAQGGLVWWKKKHKRSYELVNQPCPSRHELLTVTPCLQPQLIFIK